MGHRRRFNRPTRLGGWIAYHIAPSSQEAMAWHDAAHQRAYVDHRPRLEKHFFYLKPWEGLRIGPRVSTESYPEDEEFGPATSEALVEAVKSDEAVLSASDELPGASELLEQERFEQRQGQRLTPPSPPPPVAAPPVVEPQIAEPQVADPLDDSL